MPVRSAGHLDPSGSIMPIASAVDQLVIRTHHAYWISWSSGSIWIHHAHWISFRSAGHLDPPHLSDQL